MQKERNLLYYFKLDYLNVNIELSPAVNKTVTVKGNLTVEKEITGKLSSAMKQELIQEIKQSLNK